jgi:hypothetical protein
MIDLLFHHLLFLLLHYHCFSSANVPLAKCYKRDEIGHHESFCLLTLCRGPISTFYIPSKDHQRLIRNGEDAILERVWNFGQVEIINSSILPINNNATGVVLINNANHGSAHLAMYFAFPALSVIETLGLQVIGIRHRLPNFELKASTVPWASDFVPLLHQFLINAPSIGINGYDEQGQLKCHRSVIFHEIDMRSHYKSIEVTPRWFFSREIAQKTTKLLMRHTILKGESEVNILRKSKDCRYVIIDRETSLQGKVTKRKFKNMNQLINSIKRFVSSIENESGEICIVKFENTSLKFQATVMNQASIVIGVHGAALTNIAWLNQCSIVVEMFPHLIWNHGMYHGLTLDVGAIYRRSVSKNDFKNVENVRKNVRQDLLGDDKNCLKKYVEKYGWTDLKRECTKDIDCSQCSRDQDVTVDVRVLVEQLSGAWEERQKCLESIYR